LRFSKKLLKVYAK